MRNKFLTLALVIAIMLGALSLSFAQEPVKVVWYVGLGAGGQPEQVEAQNKVVADFNASHPDIVLEIQIVDNNVAYDTLSTLIASAAVGGGQAPDIIGPVGQDGSNAFAGRYLGLDALIESTGYDVSQFDEGAVEAYRVDGELIGLPFATFPTSIYFRRDLFDEAGLNYPPQVYGEPYVMPDGTEVEWTMDTLREVAMMLTVDSNGADATMDDFNAESIEQWGFISQWNEPRGISTMFGASSLVAEDGNAQLPQAWVDAFNWYYNGMWADHFIPTASQDGSDLLAAGNAFSSGRVAMAHTHLWYTCCVGTINTWDMAVMPSHNGVTTAKLHGDTFRILNTTQNPEAAFEVLTYLLGEAAPTLLQVYGGMPARAEQTEAFFAALDETFPQGVNWQVAVDSLAYADSPNHEYNMPNYLKAKDRIGAFQTLYGGDGALDINAALETLVADLDAIFDEVE
jgi:multiple sugar transport system substrate-binding protein